MAETETKFYETLSADLIPPPPPLYNHHRKKGPLAPLMALGYLMQTEELEDWADTFSIATNKSTFNKRSKAYSTLRTRHPRSRVMDPILLYFDKDGWPFHIIVITMNRTKSDLKRCTDMEYVNKVHQLVYSQQLPQWYELDPTTMG